MTVWGRPGLERFCEVVTDFQIRGGRVTRVSVGRVLD